MTFGIKTLSIVKKNAKHGSYFMSSMVSVANKPIMLNVVILNVVMLSVFMLNVVILNVFMLSVFMLNVYAECHVVEIFIKNRVRLVKVGLNIISNHFKNRNFLLLSN